MSLTPDEIKDRQAAGGRKSFKLNQRRLAKILELVGHGNYINRSAAAVGIGERTIRRYVAEGAQIDDVLTAVLSDDEGDVDLEALANVDHERQDITAVDWIAHCEMPQAVRDAGIAERSWMCWLLYIGLMKAEANGEAFAVTMLKAHMKDSPHAVIAFLERRHHGGWRRRDKVELETANAADEAKGEAPILESDEAQEHVVEALRVAGQAQLQRRAEAE